MTADCKLKRSTGTTKVSAKRNFEKNVDNVDSHVSRVFLLSDSVEICIPRASENASAIAIVNIPPITASFEFVPELKPVISPRVVIIPEVIPKQIPILSDCFMNYFYAPDKHDTCFIFFQCELSRDFCFAADFRSML